MSAETIGVVVRVFTLRAMRDQLERTHGELEVLAGVAGAIRTWDAEKIAVELREAVADLGVALVEIDAALAKAESES